MMRLIQRLNRSFARAPYSRVLVSTLPNVAKKTHFIPNNFTVGQLAARLESSHPQFSVYAVDREVSSVWTAQLQELSPQTIKANLLEKLIFNDVDFYLCRKNTRVPIQMVAVEVKQYNVLPTRHVNLHTANSLVDIFEEMGAAKTVGQLLNKSINRTPTQANEDLMNQKALQFEFKKLSQQLFADAMEAKQAFRIMLAPTHQFGRWMVGCMGINWLFLLWVTYGKYGWDVGEPISYLTSLGIDLVAMVGFFEVSSKMNELRERDSNIFKQIKNYQAHWRSHEFKMSHLRLSTPELPAGNPEAPIESQQQQKS